MGWQDSYLDRFYRSRPGWQDGTREFHALCRANVPAGGRILEIGAGPSNATTRMLATLGEVHGVDPDPDVRSNDALARAELLDGDRIPYPDRYFDAAVSNYVVEHVADPRAHLSEVRRVLRPGAPYVFRTPNRFHYVALVSAATPHWFHRLVANRVRNQVGAHDPYPTVYAMNEEGALRRFAGECGFDVGSFEWIEKEPSYLMMSRLAFLLGVAYERAVNATERARILRSNLFVVLRRRASATDAEREPS
jgi:SAM-dependent methyltransferase